MAAPFFSRRERRQEGPASKIAEVRLGATGASGPVYFPTKRQPLFLCFSIGMVSNGAGIDNGMLNRSSPSTSAAEAAELERAKRRAIQINPPSPYLAHPWRFLGPARNKLSKRANLLPGRGKYIDQLLVSLIFSVGPVPGNKERREVRRLASFVRKSWFKRRK